MEKLTKKDEMYQKIVKHGEQLKAIFKLPAETEPIKLCKSLRRLETKASRVATNWCNGDITEEEFFNEKGKILMGLQKIIGQGLEPTVFFNSDPRGYAIKIDDKWCIENRQSFPIYTDWGGYGIIAPDFT